MALSTSTGSLAVGASRTFNLSPGSALTLVAPPNVRATIIETPNTVDASGVGGNASRVHNLQLAQTVTYGPYPMGGTVVVANASNSGGAVTWVRSDALVAESASGVVSLVSGDGNVFLRQPAQKWPGGIWCDWQSGTGTLAMVSTDAGDDIALDSTVQLDGVSVPKCTFSNAASGTFLADFTFTNAVSLKGFKTIQLPLKITSSDSTGGVALNTAPFQVWLYLSGGGTIRLQCDAANVPPGYWHVFSWSRESPAGMVTFASGATAWSDLDSQTITKVRIVQATIAASVSYPVWVGPLRCDARSRGVVSIVMDGQYSSQYTILKPLLDQHKIKTSLAIVNSDIGGTGRMTVDQISEMYREGHECIHHTYDGTKTNGYLNATDWATAAAISSDIKLGFAYFITQGWTRGIGKIVNAFSNPFDKAVATARQQLILSAMRSAGVQCSRASTGLYTTQMSLGYSGVKPFHLRGAIQITSTDTASSIQTIIDQAETNGEWAIITVHRAVESSPGSLEMTTANFATWLAYLKARVDAGGIDVRPLGEAYDKYFA